MGQKMNFLAMRNMLEYVRQMHMCYENIKVMFLQSGCEDDLRDEMIALFLALDTLQRKARTILDGRSLP